MPEPEGFFHIHARLKGILQVQDLFLLIALNIALALLKHFVITCVSLA